MQPPQNLGGVVPAGFDTTLCIDGFHQVVLGVVVRVEDPMGARERALEQLFLPDVIRSQHAYSSDTRMVRDELGSQSIHEAEDWRPDIGHDLVEEGLAYKAGQ